MIDDAPSTLRMLNKKCKDRRMIRPNYVMLMLDEKVCEYTLGNADSIDLHLNGRNGRKILSSTKTLYALRTRQPF